MSKPHITQSVNSTNAQQNASLRRVLTIYYEEATSTMHGVGETDTIGEVGESARHKALEILKRHEVNEGSDDMLPEHKEIMLVNKNHAPAEFRDERTVDVLCTTKHDHIIAVVPSVSFHPPKRSAFDQIRSPINDAAADYTALLQATIKRLENLGRALQGERKTSKDEEKELAQGLREERKARDKALREERSAREKALQEERKERQNLERRWEKQQSIANAEAAKARDECRAAKELSDGEIHTLRTEVNGLSDKVDELKSETAMLRSRVETNSSDISVVIDALGRFETIPDKTMIDLDKIARRALLDQAQALLAKAVG